MSSLLIHRMDVSARRFMFWKYGDEVAPSQMLVDIPKRPQYQPMPIKRQTDYGFAVVAAQRACDLKGLFFTSMDKSPNAIVTLELTQDDAVVIWQIANCAGRACPLQIIG